MLYDLRSTVANVPTAELVVKCWFFFQVGPICSILMHSVMWFCFIWFQLLSDFGVSYQLYFYEFVMYLHFRWINDDDDDVLRSMLSSESDGHESRSDRRDGPRPDAWCLPGRQSASLHHWGASTSNLDPGQPSDVSAQMAENFHTCSRWHLTKLGHGDCHIAFVVLFTRST